MKDKFSVKIDMIKRTFELDAIGELGILVAGLITLIAIIFVGLVW